jgi:hypothetical protein
MILRVLAFALLIFIYGISFFQQERLSHQTDSQLSFPLPAKVQEIGLGYLHQLGAEMLYIKTTVFLGGLEPGYDRLLNASSLAENFTVISKLHPQFVDTYYVCESSLPSIDEKRARAANDILRRGIAALPDNWVLSFFLGFNYFYYLNEPEEAARPLKMASELPDAPVWLAHLASVLAAEGGDIFAGLMWLNGMLANEEDESLRRRYREDLSAFEKAAVVLQATHAYREKYHQSPPALDDLVPEFLTNLPQIPDDGFVLSWDPPILRLVRPKH